MQASSSMRGTSQRQAVRSGSACRPVQVRVGVVAGAFLARSERLVRSARLLIRLG